MLKIKDSLNLKELEKYGFERKQYFYLSYEYEQWGIRIEETTKKISLLPNSDITLLYDLIKDNLIEKVK